MKNSFVRLGDSVTFVCKKGDFIDKITGDLYISGTFCNWIPFNEPGVINTWKMEQSGETYTLQKNISKLLIPGNTGFAEYAFYTFVDGEPIFLHEKSSAFDNFLLDNHILIIDEFFKPGDKNYSNGDKFAIKIFSKIKAFKTVKRLSDFNLESRGDCLMLSNFRLVPGTRKIFRGYHPYKKSKVQFDTEDARIMLVNKLLEEYKIKSVITLCNNEPLNQKIGEEKSDIIKEIEQNNNHFFIDISYNDVYYHSDGVSIQNALRDIINFILEHDAPFYIHCRLGSDRTGFVSAVIALLCGATWDEVSKDYEFTSNMGVGEYRCAKLLEYSLRRFVLNGELHNNDKMPRDIFNMGDISQTLIQVLLKNSIIDKSKLYDLRQKLLG